MRLHQKLFGPGLGLVLSACNTVPRVPLDLLRADKQLQEASVAGRDRAWVQGQTGRPFRLDDSLRRTLPAAPPSRLRFHLDIPAGARLSLNYAIHPEFHDRPGVEFMVKVRREGREETVWISLLEPLKNADHRRWAAAEVDLSKQAGRDRDLILETRGYEASDDPRRAVWGVPAMTVPDDKAPLIILYLVDTLRADHTQPYGYARDTTPELLTFAKDAVVFEKAIAQASWTKPSVASVFTSLLPGRHLAVQLRDPLASGHVTLAEMLQAKGYATGASIANSVIYAEGSNFEQGFDSWVGVHDSEGRASKEVKAADVVDAGLEWLATRRGFPTFLYVHTMDPHVPYSPPAPFNMKFQPHPTPDHPAADPRTDYKEPLDRDRLIAQYDGDIAYGDQEFGRFVRELKKRGLYERALIVFMGDHGEEFEDHGKWLHGRSVFDELVRIPLIVKFPGGREAGRRIEQQVQEVDVLPTILESQGLPVPAPPVIAGRPLQAVIRGGAPEPPAVSEISHRGFVAHGMRTNRDKYVQRFSPEEDELYFDLTKDPTEKVNRLDEARDRVRALKAAGEAAMVPDPFRRHLKLQGPGEYALKLRTGGWIEGVEPVGFGPDEHYELEGNGRKLALLVRPRPGKPREIAFSLRPMGAPAWLEGTRDGRPLKPEDVYMAQEGVHPKEIPVRFPEIEAENFQTKNVLAAPDVDRPGLHLWLTPTQGRELMGKFDKETCERLKALGYIGSCAGF